MSAQQAAAEQALPRARSAPWVVLSYLAIGLAAALPRMLNLGVFLSGDESQFWIHRSAVFLQALRTRDWAATAISTHPGVTTMWLGSAGMLLRRALTDWGWLQDQSFPTLLAVLRMPTALMHVAAILLGYALLRRMLAPAAAALAALLWALDPFVVAFSRVLHVDALAGTFMTLSALAACLYWHHQRRARWLILSGVAAGLALLSKSPGLALVPWVGLVALLGVTNDQRPTTKDQRPNTNASFGLWSLVVGPSSVVVPLLAWGAVAAITVFALWPALWVSPLDAFRQIQIGVEAEGAQPHMMGNFFLGRQDDSPGALFYPVALALRLTPWTLLGLLLLAPAWWRLRDLERRDLAALACLALIVVAALTLFPKKFNRYVEPIFPALDIMAAVGLVGILDFGFWILDFRRNHSKIENRKSKISLTWVGIIAIGALANVAWWHPYEIAAFNQALGGAQAGANTFTTGWGEGLGEVAAWLNAQPDIAGVVTVSTMVNGLQEYMREGAQATTRDGPLPRKAGYVVVYVRNVQWSPPWPPFDEFYGRETPLHVVSIHGVDYAWIYRAPPPTAQLVQADFGADIHLRGFDPGAPAYPGQSLTYRLVWKTRSAPAADATLFAHLIGADGRRYAQTDLPYPTSGWRANQYVTTELALPLPADLPAGTYRLTIGLYRAAGRLPLRAGAPIDPTRDGPDALVLDTVEIK